MNTTRARTRQPILSAPLLTDSVLAKQIETETRAQDEGVRLYRSLARKAVERGDGASLKPAERLLAHWFEPLEAMIEREQSECKRGLNGVGRMIHGPVIVNMKAAKLAVITMHEVVSALMAEPGGVPLVRVAYAVGRAIFGEYNLLALKDADSESRHKRRERGAKGKDRREDEYEPFNALVHRFKNLSVHRVNWWANKTLDDHGTHRKAATAAGAALIHELIECAAAGDYDDFPSCGYAFTTETRRIEKGKDQIFLLMAENVYDIIDRGHDARSKLRPRYLPMIVPPYRWSKDAQGGYVKIRTPFISKPTRSQKDALEHANLANTYDCLDAVGETAWQANPFTLDVVNRMWDSGGGLLRIPPAENLPMPPHPAGYDVSKPMRERWAAVPRGEKERYNHEASLIHGRNLPIKASRFEFTQKLGVAKDFADCQAFYYPHQLDFRSRCYPIPAHLNHQGDDPCRGLLQFADAKPPGDGEKWIMVQAANTWGHDKVGYADRLKWVRENIEGIIASADRPLECEFWHKAKKPWQFLAACRAIKDPDAAAHLPVDQDGTCNGLQHYAALARDPVAAARVNMVPGDKPHSVYLDVAASAEALVRADAQNRIAAEVLPMVGKDLVKQPTMTAFYSATPVGMREQVEGVLAEDFSVHEDRLFELSVYIVGIIERSVREVSPTAVAIMEWFRTCAKLAATAGHLFSWETGLGFPVVQPYRKWRKQQVNTLLGRIQVIVEEESAPVAVKDHIDGSAPNIVHSVDATHMFLTARECRRQKVTAAFVHDAYRTHAATREAMGQILREQFVKTHEGDVLADLYRQWCKVYPKVDIPKPPPRGSYDLNQVGPSDYFFN